MPEPGILYTIAWFILLLTVLVFVHEWGHYIVARIFGVRVDTFSIGFGREIFGWTDKKMTRWKISWIPLGGYVKFHGDASVISNPQAHLDKIPKEERDYSFHFKPLWQRTLIVAAGPLINLIFAFFVFIGLSLVQGEIINEPLIGTVIEGDPAYEAGLMAGDRVLEADGRQLETYMDFRAAIIAKPEQPVSLSVLREEAVVAITVIPVADKVVTNSGEEVTGGRIGIEAAVTHSPVRALVNGTRITGIALGSFFDFLRRLTQGNVSMEEVGGPVKIAQITGEQAAVGFSRFVWVLGLISINLGLINLLPIPLLDGGHLLFYSIEAVKGRPISAKAQEVAAMLGLAFVLTLLFVVTWNDLNLPGLG